MTDQIEAEVDPAPRHDIRLQSVGSNGLVRAVCSCGLYQSMPTTDRQKAHRLARAHARYYIRKWKAVL